MKTMMKKTAAYLMALLLIFQIMPAFADTYSGTFVQSNVVFRDQLEIISERNTTILTVGMTDQLTIASEYDYKEPVWTSDHPEIATVDEETGLVTAVSPGKVTITVTSEKCTDNITYQIMAGASEQKADEPETTQPADGGEQAKDEKLIIIISGNKTKVEYNGQLQVNGYSVTPSNPDLYDESLLTVNTEHFGQGTECNVYMDELSADDFSYAGNAEIVVSNGWIQIKPAPIQIKADDQKVLEGRGEPAYTATVTEGLVEGESIDLSGVTFTTAGDKIIPEIEKGAIIGNYRVSAVFPGTLTVVKLHPLYNIAKIGNNYYRLAKTQIWTEKVIKEHYGEKLKAEDYVADAYDFTDLTITIDGKEYVYNCKQNAAAIVDGANYYEIKSVVLSAIKNKIGALDSNNNPRWLVPEEDRYPDKNGTDSFHRDFEIVLHENKSPATEQLAYTMLSVDGSTDYYKLPTTTIKAQPVEKVKMGVVEEEKYNLTRYDFSNTVLNIDGVEYKYNDGSLDEYENYFTVAFVEVQKVDKFNRNDAWFKKTESWLDGAYAEYGNKPNTTTAFHANYAATTHKAEKRQRSITISSDFAGINGYVGDRITLTAHLTGFEGLTEGVDYRLEWQYTINKDSWKAVPNANGTTYTFTLDQTTTRYTWRVVAIDLE